MSEFRKSKSIYPFGMKMPLFPVNPVRSLFTAPLSATSNFCCCLAAFARMSLICVRYSPFSFRAHS